MWRLLRGFGVRHLGLSSTVVIIGRRDGWLWVSDTTPRPAEVVFLLYLSFSCLAGEIGCADVEFIMPFLSKRNNKRTLTTKR